MLVVLKVYILVAQAQELTTLELGLQIDGEFGGETQASMRAVVGAGFVQGIVKEKKGYWMVARELLIAVKLMESLV